MRQWKQHSSFFLFSPADEASLYMLGSSNVQLYEVKAFDEDFHSWFIGQTVQRGWSHYIVNSNVIES